ncbi:calcium and integrin-binding protein 1 isoform X2 [Rhinatrema bivittatum]|uniref:calcium and integrin-binding protein 1 isoform X2 n=1 Tax=Rhinatrema bivittatum TaxID=194408 RepID=UPI001126B72B|nr:calcium and integrin-binding protein 1 isoform X2 [Rhinatrema bivittatum]
MRELGSKRRGGGIRSHMQIAPAVRGARCRGDGDVGGRAESSARSLQTLYPRRGRKFCLVPGWAMGGTSSLLSKDLLSEYQELTFLTKQEILLAYKKFAELLPKEERSSILSVRIPKAKILTLPELKANPFQHRICHVFSTSEYQDDSMSFEDFLDMLSVFSDSASPEIKSHYAFRIFDFDDDGTLDTRDLENLVNCLTGDAEDTKLSESEMDQLIQNFFQDRAVRAWTSSPCTEIHLLS